MGAPLRILPENRANTGKTIQEKKKISRMMEKNIGVMKANIGVMKTKRLKKSKKSA
jgi:hypothetical protein